jgi:hypothetical protein
MGQFHQGRARFFRRYSGCERCDAPCSYQPFERRPSPEAQAAALALLSMVLFNPDPAQLTAVRGRMEAGLVGEEPPSLPGERLCAQIQLSRWLAEQFYRAAGGNRWQWYLELQQNLLAVWTVEDPQPSSAALGALRRLVLQRLAARPRLERPGCADCKARCWFGWRLTPRTPAVQALARQLSVGPGPGQPALPAPGAADIQMRAVQALGGQVMPGLRAWAGYCLLVQAGSGPRQLAAYTQALSAKQ